MHYSPKVLFLDEPTLGWTFKLGHMGMRIDLNEKEGDRHIFNRALRGGSRIFIGRIAIIDQGKVIVTDALRSLRDSIGNDGIIVHCKNCLKPELKKRVKLKMSTIRERVKMVARSG